MSLPEDLPRPNKPAVLIFCAFYLPGFMGGGPIRTVANLVENLGDDFDFFVVALDRDLGRFESYESINKGQWNIQGKARVFYVEPGIKGYLKIFSMAFRFPYDILYLNSFFSFGFSIFPTIAFEMLKRLKGKRFQRKIILGPRGEFSTGALKIKSFKKTIYLIFFKCMGLRKAINWHASTEYESRDIRKVLGAGLTVRTAIDLSVEGGGISLDKASPKKGKSLRIIFVSRISPKKNLVGALSMIRNVGESIFFDVYGPLEDERYWVECLAEANLLPENIKFSYRGLLRPEEVVLKMLEYDLLFFPTFGENYGHVIAEAVMAGLPLLISDQTPWRDLEKKKLGWDISLDRPNEFVRAIENCSAIEPSKYFQWRQEIVAWAKINMVSADAIEANRRLFLDAK